MVDANWLEAEGAVYKHITELNERWRVVRNSKGFLYKIFMPEKIYVTDGEFKMGVSLYLAGKIAGLKEAQQIARGK